MKVSGINGVREGYEVGVYVPRPLGESVHEHESSTGAANVWINPPDKFRRRTGVAEVNLVAEPEYDSLYFSFRLEDDTDVGSQVITVPLEQVLNLLKVEWNRSVR